MLWKFNEFLLKYTYIFLCIIENSNVWIPKASLKSMLLQKSDDQIHPNLFGNLNPAIFLIKSTLHNLKYCLEKSAKIKETTKLPNFKNIVSHHDKKGVGF